MNQCPAQGFTLIELVMVIVLIGILASVALPRFLNISDDAHQANVSATAGAIASALNIAHAKWLASGQPVIDDHFNGIDYLNTGFTSMGFNAEGWPVAANDGTYNLNKDDVLTESAASALICKRIISNLLSSASLSFGVKNNCGQSYCATYQQGQCIYTYQKNSQKPRKIVYSIKDGSITQED